MKPPRGSMILYDRIDPPLPAGKYRVDVKTTIDSTGHPELSGASLPDVKRYFNVEGPRFRLAPTEISGVFPPRNASGPFSDAMPHVALGRRTLPWERSADPGEELSLPSPESGDPPRIAEGPAPWLALLLFDDTDEPEADVLSDVAVSEVLPSSIFQKLAPPADARCNAIEVDRALLRDVLPSLEELHLLTHVRQVNVEDRELSAGDSDGWFAVVVCARIPQPNRKYLACLVSLEGRTDLIQEHPPPVAVPPGAFEVATRGELAMRRDATDAVHHVIDDPRLRFVREDAFEAARWLPAIPVPRERLVLLYSWRFECNGLGTFQGHCEQLDAGMIGDVNGEWPKVTDTGHLPVEMRDRAGALQQVWYRGPLVPMPVSRDTRGPYHAADQALRVSPETGMSDISYAAAFEVGRLLAAADARLAQELMRWRRGDFRRSVEKALMERLRFRLPELLERFELFDVAAELIKPWIDPHILISDPRELSLVLGAPGLDPVQLADAWGITEPSARAALAPELTAAGTGAFEAEVETRFEATTIDRIAGNLDLLAELADVRAQLDGPASFDLNGIRFEPGRGGGGTP